MDARFAPLDALVISMAAYVKFIASRLGKAKDWENG
jgi:hypothetical protein